MLPLKAILKKNFKIYLSYWLWMDHRIGNLLFLWSLPFSSPHHTLAPLLSSGGRQRRWRIGALCSWLLCCSSSSLPGSSFKSLARIGSPNSLICRPVESPSSSTPSSTLQLFQSCSSPSESTFTPVN